MAGYRCVNFHDLCRLCSSVGDDKNIQIYSNDGLLKKINECLPITLSEKDKLPKIICSTCREYIEIFSDFRKSCTNAQKMLESCINSAKLSNGGQVYIKDEVPVKKILKPIQNSSPTKIIPNINIIATTPTKSANKNVITSSQPDFLSSIMQAVGIQASDEASENNSVTISQPNVHQTIQSLPQYTLTLDGNTLKTGQIQYKIENAGNLLGQTPIITANNLQDIQNQQVTINQVDEFLKLNQKPSLIVKKESTVNPNITITASKDEPKDKKPKFNLILQTSQKPQSTTAPTKTIFNSPNKAQILNIEKIIPTVSQTTPTKQVVLPIMVRSDGTRNAFSSNDAAQILSQALSLSANQAAAGENKTPVQQKPFAYMQMKLQSNADGQITFTPATNNTQQFQLSLSPQQIQQLGLQTSQPTAALSVQPQLSAIPAQQQFAQDSQTQTQPQESPEKHDENQDDMYDAFDSGDYQADDIESANDVDEKLLMERVSAQKKTKKALKPAKAKIKTEPYAEPPVNPEHSEMAKKQLTLLMCFNVKRIESENAEKCGDLNLTVCDVCKKKFKRKEFLMQHLKSHIGLRPFKCEEPECNKSFSRKEHLLRHISSHTGKKEFTCNICNKLFSRKDNLNKHKRIHPDGENQNSHDKTQIIKCEPGCDGKANIDENVKDVKPKTQPAKKVKIKQEKKEDATAKVVSVQNQIISQQQPKIVQVLQSQHMKSDNQEQIILSMSQAQAMLSQQGKAVYTIPTNFILNPHGAFVTGTANSDGLGNIKFETH